MAMERHVAESFFHSIHYKSHAESKKKLFAFAGRVFVGGYNPSRRLKLLLKLNEDSSVFPVKRLLKSAPMPKQ